MEGKARLIGSISGRAYGMSDVTAKAVAFDGVLTGRADAFGMLGGDAERTRDTGLHHFLYVQPEQPQEIVWLDPFGIDYSITTSTNLKWQIE